MLVDDGLTGEDIENVRESCQKMVAAVEAAGGVEAWEEARKALLATVFMSYPDLDEGDVEKYMAIRGLVSGTNRETFSMLTSKLVG